MLSNRMFRSLTVAGALVTALAWHPQRVGTQNGLDENCVVSILNRTAQVRADGSWDLPNVPAGFGLVRARATCVRNGVTLSGESAPFTITAGRMNAIPPIVLGPTTPIPTALSITTSTPVLTQVGQATPLTVTATYVGGTSQNVTAASTGTSYTTTNAAIAAVTSGGIVNALRSGTVIIRASNEGTAGLISIKVQLAGDTDGDGIPDDVELEAGLNPNNPVDALEDADQDGLSNLAEFDRGTKIRDADTDDDGISDGEEVKAGADGFITNPLLADSDNDGLRDALEIATGSNPNDPASRNLAQALARIEIAPTTFALTVNAIILEASRQLTVTGVLKDATTINLTSTQSGTNYTSSSLTVCNFGSPDGRVFAGANGSCTITATNSGFTAQSHGTVTSFTPTPLSFVAIPGFANNVDVSGNFAYVAAGSTGLQIVSVSNRNAPVIVAALDTPGNANDVRVVGNLAYIADGSAGLRIVDVTNPLAPVLAGSFDTSGEAWDVVVSDNRAYVADGDAGLQIINVANPAAPNLLGTVNPPGTQKGVDIDPIRNLVVLASGFNGIHVVDVTNPASPVVIGSATGGDARDVAIKGLTALVADFSRSLTPVDISVPSNPIPGVSTPSNTGGLLQDVVVSGNFTLGADVLFVNGVPIADVSNPSTPIPRTTLNFGNFRDDNGTGVAADASFVYLTAERGISENGVSGDTRLYIGQYLALEDREGIAPTVQITAPAAGSTFLEGSSIPITVAAADDIAVASVSFSVNGELRFTDTSAPYQFSLTAPQGVSGVTLGATAVDLGGNVATSATVQVNVIPDPLTTVTGRVVRNAVSPVPVAGATVSVGNLTTTSIGDGTFTLANVPTASGSVIVQASAVVAGSTLSGLSLPAVPVPSGTTSVGDILIGAGSPAFAIPSPSNFRNDSWSFGQIFTVGALPITVTSLGVYDANGDGFVSGTALPVGLYRESDGALLVATTVSSADPLVSGFRYKSIPPLTLLAGVRYRVVAVNLADLYNVSNFTVRPDITSNGYGYARSTTLVSSNSFTGNGVLWFANFQYHVNLP